MGNVKRDELGREPQELTSVKVIGTEVNVDARMKARYRPVKGTLLQAQI